ncbi:hypothetical protein Anapl_04045 [Anas platyrhynchos]|uniref:Uncharacterized protein n=1 Tax=Anas platyrhynchos TaxID=8839 RepID=R0LXA7_ANAPL|nr:hypothetical protein Anapl_04045 [Anas platyrhynchos]
MTPTSTSKIYDSQHWNLSQFVVAKASNAQQPPVMSVEVTIAEEFAGLPSQKPICFEPVSSNCPPPKPLAHVGSFANHTSSVTAAGCLLFGQECHPRNTGTSSSPAHCLNKPLPHAKAEVNRFLRGYRWRHALDKPALGVHLISLARGAAFPIPLDI